MVQYVFVIWGTNYDYHGLVVFAHDTMVALKCYESWQSLECSIAEASFVLTKKYEGIIVFI